MPSSGSCLALASRFSKRSVSRESIQPDCRLHRCLRHQVSLLTLCPLGQPKKAIGRESEIEPWLTHAQRNRLACPRFRKSIGVHICFPSSAMVSERSSPSRVRFAAPNGAPFDGHYRVHYAVTLFAEICKYFVNVHKEVLGAGTIRF